MCRFAGTRRVLVRLLFVENQFVFPTPMVARNQFLSRVFDFVQQVGEERVLFLMAARCGSFSVYLITRTTIPPRSFWRLYPLA